MNDVRTRMRGAAVSSVGAGRSGRRGKFVRDTGRWQHCRLYCCDATGNPSLNQVFISLSLSLSLFFPIPSLTLCYSVLRTEGNESTLYSYIRSTLLLVKFHMTKELFVCNPSWSPPLTSNRTTGPGTT